MDEIRLFFVLQKNRSCKDEVSEAMSEAYEACKQSAAKVRVLWVKEGELDPATLMKTDFLVFEEFTGKAFEDAKTSKCAILGPWAVRVCLTEGKAIPNYPHPIYNVAMYKCVITCSNLPNSLKVNVKDKVELMGGCCVKALTELTTHLVTNSVKSEKYLKAAEAKVKLMTPSWVEEVWKRSQFANVHGDGEEFEQYRCLTFSGLTIVTTGLQPSIKKDVENLVSEYGGTYSGKLYVKNTDFLICHGDLSSNEKFKLARQRSINCVTLDWVYDSIAKGYALPHTDYSIQKTTSTPTKRDKPVNPEFSILSAIGGNNSTQNFVNDTVSSPVTSECSRGSVKRKVGLKDYGHIIDTIDMKKAKMAGHYLDGCSVYITGFSTEHTEKLNKIINLSGATRYDTYSHRVTHIIVGSSIPYEEFEFIKSKSSCALVTVHWLVDSIEQMQAVREESYLFSISELEKNQPGSPLSKKGLNLLRSVRTVTEQEMNSVSNVAVEENEEHSRRELVEKYLDPGSSTCEDDTLAKYLGNVDCLVVKFLIVGFSDEEVLALSEKVASFSGEVVTKSFKGIPDFVVVPVFNNDEVHHTATEIVNEFYIYECEQKQELIKEILYCHRPFQLPSTKPLQNCVITLTCYHNAERWFLKSLIEGLGGVAQDQFARVTSVAKGVIGCTHLVSPEATGKKYEAALKWGLPVVGMEWLIECAKTGQYVNEEDFLVGEAKVPERKSCVSDTSRTHSPNISDQGKSLNTNFSDTSISSQETKTQTPPNPVNTPLSKIFDKVDNSAEKPFSQVTPISKIIKNFRDNNADVSNKTPIEQQQLEPWMNMKTPDTPLGAFLTPNPSPGTRKQWAYWLSQFSDRPSPKSNQSTPLSEIKRKLWNKALSRQESESNSSISGDGENVLGNVVPLSEIKNKLWDKDNQSKQESENNSSISRNDQNVLGNVVEPLTPRNETIASRLELLEQMLSSSAGKKRSRNLQSTTPVPAVNCGNKDSQPCTIGWDYDQEGQEEMPGPQIKIFSLSGITEDARKMMVEQIESLGGSVSDLSNYDPSCTHLLCPKPARNEKTLSCTAAGKWVLHLSYLEKSIEAGRFLNEEEYEFGNPKSAENIPISNYDEDDKETEIRMKQTYWWRKEISKRGYRAFNDMRAIVVANKQESIARVIEAGGGTVINARPPFNDIVHATHCLLEPKLVEDYTVYIPLAKQGVYVVGTLYINDYLQNPNKHIGDSILPYFTKYHI